jgi:hypothetical protein
MKKQFNINLETIKKYAKNRKVQAGGAALILAAIIGAVSYSNREVPYLPDIVEPVLETTLEDPDVWLSDVKTTKNTKKSTKTAKKKVTLKTAATKTQTKNLGTKTTKTSQTKKKDANTTVKTDVSKAVTTTEQYVKGSKIKTVVTKTVTTTTTTTMVQSGDTPAAATKPSTSSSSSSSGSKTGSSSSSGNKTGSSSTVSSVPQTKSEVKINAIAPKMPSNVSSAYQNLGFKIIVDPNYAASGHFVAKEQTTYIRATDNTIYHELGHFVAFAAGNVDTKDDFANTIYTAEKEKFTGTNKVYARQSAPEFFAESFREYVVGDKAGLQKNCPKTYAAIESAVSKINDSQVSKLKMIYGSYWK